LHPFCVTFDLHNKDVEKVPIFQRNNGINSNIFFKIMAKHPNELINKLISEMQTREKKITDVARETGIPKDRIYKWIQQGNNPKAADEKALELWINLHFSDVKAGSEAKKNPDDAEDFRAKYIKQLEKENQYLQDIVKTNLTLVLATVRTISARQLGTGVVALKSLERLEKSAGHKPGSLVKEADKEIGQIEREAFAHDNAASVGS
jgi:DNA-binding phage protein